jgi:hypothetical protein
VMGGGCVGGTVGTVGRGGGIGGKSSGPGVGIGLSVVVLEPISPIICYINCSKSLTV